jgi:hypothetical protein
MTRRSVCRPPRFSAHDARFSPLEPYRRPCVAHRLCKKKRRDGKQEPSCLQLSGQTNMSSSDSGLPPQRPRKLVLRKISTPAPPGAPASSTPMFPPSAGSVVGPLPTVTSPSVRTTGSAVAAAARLTAPLAASGSQAPPPGSGAFLPPMMPPPRSFESIASTLPHPVPYIDASGFVPAPQSVPPTSAEARPEVPPYAAPSHPSAHPAVRPAAPSYAAPSAPPYVAPMLSPTAALLAAPPSQASVAPMVAPVFPAAMADGLEYPGSLRRRSSLLIPGGVVAAGLLIAIGMILQAHRGGPSTDSESASAQAQGAAQSSASAHASPAHAPSPSSDSASQTATPPGGLVATANVDDLPRVPAPRRYVAPTAPIAPATPHPVRPARSGAAHAAGGATSVTSDSDTTDDSTAPTVQAAVAPSRKDTPAQDPATSEPAAMPAPAAAPSATVTPAAPETPVNEDPLLKAMRQAVDDQARGK